MAHGGARRGVSPRGGIAARPVRRAGRGSPRRCNGGIGRRPSANRLLTVTCEHGGMSRYLRPRRPGASIFFTVTLAERGTDRLVRHVDLLRAAVRQTRAERPFGIDAWVVLPDHLHCVWTLPEGDTEYAVRMGAIKARFSMAIRRAGFTPPHRDGGVNPALRRGRASASGSGGSGNITSGTRPIGRHMCSIAGSTR